MLLVLVPPYGVGGHVLPMPPLDPPMHMAHRPTSGAGFVTHYTPY